jgi:hypothetical protein
MSLPSSNGLAGAPVIKGLMACTAISSLASMRGGLSLARSLPHPLSAASKLFSFNQPTELAIGLFLMQVLLLLSLSHGVAITQSRSLTLFFAIYRFHFRILERNLGSSKFASYTFISCITSFLLTRLLSRLTSSSLPPHSSSSLPLIQAGVGPFWIIFSFLAQFAATIPSSSWFDVLGVRLGDKTFTFISALTLLLSTGRTSFIAGIMGFISGLLYRANLFNMRRFRIPSFLVRLFSSTIGRLLHDPPLSSSDPRSRSSRDRSNGGGGQRSPRSPTGARRDLPRGLEANERRAVEPTAEAIERLVEMGFEQSRAEQALRNTDNDVDSALQLLLEG